MIAQLAPWLLFCSVTLAVTMWPGPAFALTVRNSMAYDRRAALLTAVGLGLGVAVEIALILCGVAVLIRQSAIVYNILRYCGGAYLFYLGVRALQAKKPAAQSEDKLQDRNKFSGLAAIRSGFLTNILNAKGAVFMTAIYTQFITPSTPLAVTLLYFASSVVIETVWFLLVAALLTDPRVKRRFLGFSHWIERVCGGLLIAIAIRLVLE